MFEGELAYSFCGSPEYMSPEMILQVGHTYPVDYYCMGALLFELLIGLPPFYSRDTNEIYEAVLTEELEFPSELNLSSECKSLLRGLLCKDSKQRLGIFYVIQAQFMGLKRFWLIPGSAKMHTRTSYKRRLPHLLPLIL